MRIKLLGNFKKTKEKKRKKRGKKERKKGERLQLNAARQSSKCKKEHVPNIALVKRYNIHVYH